MTFQYFFFNFGPMMAPPCTVVPVDIPDYDLLFSTRTVRGVQPRSAFDFNVKTSCISGCTCPVQGATYWIALLQCSTERICDAGELPPVDRVFVVIFARLMGRGSTVRWRQRPGNSTPHRATTLIVASSSSSSSVD